MNKPAKLRPTILIASDSATHADLVKQLLDGEFKHVQISINPEEAGADFDRERPDVLVLGFNALEKSERHNLGLYRHSKEIHRHPHRTILMCSNEEAPRAYRLCRDGLFDDYVLFWPVASDAFRLPMAVHHALREMASNPWGSPGSSAFANQARRLEELETLFKQQMAQGDGHIEATGRAIAQAEREIGTALAGFSSSMAQGGLPGVAPVDNVQALEQAFTQLNREAIAPPLHAAAERVLPLKQWADQLKAAALQRLQSFQAPAEHVPPAIMLVDDDTFQHKIVDRLLQDSGYRALFATGGVEALNLLRKEKPQLILMDFSMPDMDGIETTRRVRGTARFADIPIIMVTGNSEEHVVTGSLQAGANDFMVKPFIRDTLLAKIALILGSGGAPPR